MIRSEIILMNIIKRTAVNRGHSVQPSISFIHIQQQQPSLLKMHKIVPKNTYPQYNTHHHKANFIADVNATTRIETNPVYDSRKDEMKTQNLENWKILTLKQIKRSKNRLAREQGEETGNKSKQKIHVSISKSNRSSSKQHNCQTPSKSQISPDNFKHLKTLSKKRYIVEKVQNKIELQSKSVSIFCE